MSDSEPAAVTKRIECAVLPSSQESSVAVAAHRQGRRHKKLEGQYHPAAHGGIERQGLVEGKPAAVVDCLSSEAADSGVMSLTKQVEDREEACGASCAVIPTMIMFFTLALRASAIVVDAHRPHAGCHGHPRRADQFEQGGDLLHQRSSSSSNRGRGRTCRRHPKLVVVVVLVVVVPVVDVEAAVDVELVVVAGVVVIAGAGLAAEAWCV